MQQVKNLKRELTLAHNKTVVWYMLVNLQTQVDCGTEIVTLEESIQNGTKQLKGVFCEIIRFRFVLIQSPRLSSRPGASISLPPPLAPYIPEDSSCAPLAL